MPDMKRKNIETQKKVLGKAIKLMGLRCFLKEGREMKLIAMSKIYN